jgi:hypothetical protein
MQSSSQTLPPYWIGQSGIASSISAITRIVSLSATTMR